MRENPSSQPWQQIVTNYGSIDIRSDSSPSFKTFHSLHHVEARRLVQHNENQHHHPVISVSRERVQRMGLVWIRMKPLLVTFLCLVLVVAAAFAMDGTVNDLLSIFVHDPKDRFSTVNVDKRAMHYDDQCQARERVPTLLSVMHHPTTGSQRQVYYLNDTNMERPYYCDQEDYLYALDHDLYRHLLHPQTRFMVHHRSLQQQQHDGQQHHRSLVKASSLPASASMSIVTLPTIQIQVIDPTHKNDVKSTDSNYHKPVNRHRHTIDSFNQGVLVSWTDGAHQSNNSHTSNSSPPPVLTDDDLIVLHCVPTTKKNIIDDEANNASTTSTTSVFDDVNVHNNNNMMNNHTDETDMIQIMDDMLHFFLSRAAEPTVTVNDEKDPSSQFWISPMLHFKNSFDNQINESTNVSSIPILPHQNKTTISPSSDSSTIVDVEDAMTDLVNQIFITYRTPQFLEAATIAQARATSKAHWNNQTSDMLLHFMHRYDEINNSNNNSNNNNNNNNNRWYIPKFPVLRDYRYCRFALYQWTQQPQLPGNEQVSYVQPTEMTSTTPMDTSQESNQGTNPIGNDVTDVGQELDTVYRLLAVSDRLYLDYASTPTGIHLAYGDDETEMVVQFATGSGGTPMVEYKTVMADEIDFSMLSTNHNKNTYHRKSRRYDDNESISAKNKRHVAKGTSTTYRSTDLCQEPANETLPGQFLNPGKLHTVRLTNLVPNTQYQYRVSVSMDLGVKWSPWYRFVSPLVAGSNLPFAYIVYGDQGCPSMGWGFGAVYTSNLAYREIDQQLHNNELSRPIVRSIHHIGDLSYAQGASHVWDEWLNMIEPIASRVPYMISVGNHEYDYEEGGNSGRDPSLSNITNGYHPSWGNFENDSGGECGVPTAKHFSMPKSTVPTSAISGKSNVSSNGVFWYSYDTGVVHTTVISSEHDISPGSIQYIWLAADLANVNRTRTPWLIVESHRPIYEAEIKWPDNGVGLALRFYLEDLLYAHQVDIMFAGHYHSYHRTCDGLYRDRCGISNLPPVSADADVNPLLHHRNAKNEAYFGPMHITVGTAGAHQGEFALYPTEWTAKFIAGEYGYGRITVWNHTDLQFQFIRALDLGNAENGVVLDDVWIHRERK
jgi:hypothetical protein